jgi:excisionase family DNA binding protein
MAEERKRDKEYLSVQEFADIRGVSETTVKRRIHDGTIQDVKTEPGPVPGTSKYRIHQSAVRSIPRSQLFGQKRPARLQVHEGGESDTSIDMSSDNAQLLADIKLFRRALDELDLRFKLIESATLESQDD